MREIQPIPSDLGHAGQRYILLRKGQKKPLEKGWQEKAYSRHDPAIEAHIAGGGNIGMLCGQGLTGR